MLQMTGFHGLPGIGEVRETFENVVWRQHFEVNRPYYTGVQLGGATRDAGNTGNTEILRAGLLLGRRKADATKAYEVVEWNPDATDGTEHIFGVLLWSTYTQHYGADDDKWFGYCLTGGLVRSAAIIDYQATSPGLEGATNGVLIRESMATSGRFRFDDGVHDWVGNGFKAIPLISSATTLTSRDSGKAFGVSGGTAVTLPPAANHRGWRAHFYGIGVTPGTIVEASGGDLLPSSPATISQSEVVEVINVDGNNFIAIPS